MKHLLSVEQLSIAEVEGLLEKAEYRLDHPIDQVLNGTVIANLFFEPSTRTRFSFEIAVKKLGGETLNFTPQTSSLEKGECLEDTVRTMESMGVDAMVVRHGANGVMRQMLSQVHVPLINAGEGTAEHPTQCLLDILTIRQEFQRLSGLTVSIIGDVVHSRVAGSHIKLLPRLGMALKVAGPKAWIPDPLPDGVRHVSMEEALQADVVMMLRVQKERMETTQIPDLAEYRQQFGLTSARAQQLPKGTIILHPAPINRHVEIDSNVVDHPKSRIFRQVTNGVAIRKAVMEEVMAGSTSGSVRMDLLAQSM